MRHPQKYEQFLSSTGKWHIIKKWAGGTAYAYCGAGAHEPYLSGPKTDYFGKILHTEYLPLCRTCERLKNKSMGQGLQPTQRQKEPKP